MWSLRNGLRLPLLSSAQGLPSELALRVVIIPGFCRLKVRSQENLAVSKCGPFHLDGCDAQRSKLSR